MLDPPAISRSSQYTTTGVTNAVECALLFVGVLPTGKTAAGFLSRYVNGP